MLLVCPGGYLQYCNKIKKKISLQLEIFFHIETWQLETCGILTLTLLVPSDKHLPADVLRRILMTHSHISLGQSTRWRSCCAVQSACSVEGEEVLPGLSRKLDAGCTFCDMWQWCWPQFFSRCHKNVSDSEETERNSFKWTLQSGTDFLKYILVWIRSGPVRGSVCCYYDNRLLLSVKVVADGHSRMWWEEKETEIWIYLTSDITCQHVRVSPSAGQRQYFHQLCGGVSSLSCSRLMNGWSPDFFVSSLWGLCCFLQQILQMKRQNRGLTQKRFSDLIAEQLNAETSRHGNSETSLLDLMYFDTQRICLCLWWQWKQKEQKNCSAKVR